MGNVHWKLHKMTNNLFRTKLKSLWSWIVLILKISLRNFTEISQFCVILIVFQFIVCSKRKFLETSFYCVFFFFNVYFSIRVSSPKKCNCWSRHCICRRSWSMLRPVGHPEPSRYWLVSSPYIMARKRLL